MSRSISASRRREGRWLWPAFAAPGLIWLVLLFLVPFYAILSVAMGTLDPIFGAAVPEWNPLKWDASSFAEVMNSTTLQVFGRTCAYVAIAGTLSLLIGYPVAYFISRHGGRFRTMLLVLLIAPFWISYLMRMLAWVNLLQDDGYVNRALMFLQILDRPKSWLAGESLTVVLGLVYGYIPFLILPLYAALDRIDRRLLEAARDLGANPLKTFLRVTLPLSRQGMLAGSVIILLPMFGDYYTPDLLSGSPGNTMTGNQIAFYLQAPSGANRGAALVIFLSAAVSVLMIYYLITVARAAREAR